jgi:hypothetical protein
LDVAGVPTSVHAVAYPNLGITSGLVTVVNAETLLTAKDGHPRELRFEWDNTLPPKKGRLIAAYKGAATMNSAELNDGELDYPIKHLDWRNIPSLMFQV